MKKRHEQKLLILSVLLLMTFNMPLLLLFDSADALGGIPIINIYLFSIWLLSILISMYVVKRHYE